MENVFVVVGLIIAAPFLFAFGILIGAGLGLALKESKESRSDPGCAQVDEIHQALRMLLNPHLVLGASQHAQGCARCHDQTRAPVIVIASYLLTKALELDRDIIDRFSARDN